MELRREGGASGPLVTGFSGGGFRVEETVFPAGLLLSPLAALPWDGAPTPEAMSVTSLGTFADLKPVPEFLLLGTGSLLVQPPRAFVRQMEDNGIGVEVMDSRAAARAWGVLRAEDRWIIAALMPL